jgi:hypothetical protein
MATACTCVVLSGCDTLLGRKARYALMNIAQSNAQSKMAYYLLFKKTGGVTER